MGPFLRRILTIHRQRRPTRPAPRSHSHSPLIAFISSLQHLFPKTRVLLEFLACTMRRKPGQTLRVNRVPLPRRGPSSQELFSDPVILSQTGYTYDRPAIERWLRQKSPPTVGAVRNKSNYTSSSSDWLEYVSANERAE
jgi:hypothetical protein